MRTLTLILCPILLLSVLACDRSESVKEDTPPTTSTTQSASSDAQKAEEGTYLFHWRVEGELNKPERALKTTVYTLDASGNPVEVGEVKDTLLIGHEEGLSAVRHEDHQVKGCGACNESDPVAACEKDKSLLSDFSEDRLLITLPDEKTVTQALLPAPTPGEAIAFHTPYLDYHGQLGPYLFVTYHLSQMPCYASGNTTSVEYAALDTRSGERVNLLSPTELSAAGEQVDVKISAIGQANAMYEGFDGELALKAVQFYFDGSEPAAVYFYEGSCGEPCSGMVDETQEVTVELPSAILPEAYTSKVQPPAPPIAALLDAPNPARLAQGWSTLPITATSKQRVEALLDR